MSKSPQNPLEQLNAAIRRDPRKAGVLALLLVVLLVVIVRSGTGSSGPASAQAGGVGAGIAGTAVTSSITALRPLRPENPAVAVWLSDKIVAPTRNLFAVRLDYFPLDPSKSQKPQANAQEETFWTELEKSLAQQADEASKRESLVNSLKQQAQAIRPQSTIMGPNPRAMINGQMVGEGDVVASFRVIKIEARRIIVEREGIRLDVPMK